MEQKIPPEIDDFLATLREDLEPVGALKEILVEKIAICCWRQRRVLKCEAGMTVHDLADAKHKNIEGPLKSFDPILEKTTRHLNLPLNDNFGSRKRSFTPISTRRSADVLESVLQINEVTILAPPLQGLHKPHCDKPSSARRLMHNTDDGMCRWQHAP